MEREVLKLLLEVNESMKDVLKQINELIAENKALKEALAQPAQEPVAWAVYDKRGGSKSLHWPEQHSPDGDANMFDAVPLVPQRTWVGLTPEEILDLFDATNVYGSKWIEFARAVETKIKEKNNE
jgi:hypothetical protein